MNRNIYYSTQGNMSSGLGMVEHYSNDGLSAIEFSKRNILNPLAKYKKNKKCDVDEVATFISIIIPNLFSLRIFSIFFVKHFID